MAHSRNSKSGFVYIAESERQNGDTKIYVGMTGRPVHERVAEHRREVETGNRRTWCGRGRAFRLLGFRFVDDRYQKERELKKLSPDKKRELAKSWCAKNK